MKDTSFRPPPALKSRIAPTDCQGSGLRWGEVSDPTAYRMGGVAGNAGVFSTADDLALLAQMLLDGGRSQGNSILSPEAVAAMTKPQAPAGQFHPARPRLGYPVPLQPGLQRRVSRRFLRAHRLYRHLHLDRSPLQDLHDHPHHPPPSQRPWQVKPLRAKTAAAVAAAVPMGPPAAGNLI